jgi:hypothetical protein
MLNNRELASVIWLGAFLLFALSKREVRKSLQQVMMLFFHVHAFGGAWTGRVARQPSFRATFGEMGEFRNLAERRIKGR